jgi:hypothetical protein
LVSYLKGFITMIKLDTWVNDDCTVGRLSYGDFKCFTIELPWLDNAQSISCIPAGTYGIEKYKSQSKGSVLLLKDVPNRAWIEIHAGNYTRQIQGCVLVGDSIRYLDADNIPDVANSKNTLRALLAAMPDECEITITRTP